MIIEIGTSDFRTAAGVVDGLFVEPVKEYFDRLPECRKENVAVSNREGVLHVYYIPSAVIEQRGLPGWLRGCNSIDKIHPTIKKMGLQRFCVVDEVPVVRIKTLIDKHEIKDIELLKIDTEGHDCVILNDFLDTCDLRPAVIQFEANILSNKAQVYALCDRLEAIGYKCERVKFDMVCRL